MKIFQNYNIAAILSVLFLASATSAATLRGVQSEIDTNMDHDEGRSLSYDWTFEYGACRADHYGHDNGREGKDYYLYKHKSYDWCHYKCKDYKYCKAFEYSDDRCEIWTTYPPSTEKKHGFKCVFKPKYEPPQPPKVYEKYSGACRKDYYGKDQGYEGKDYYKYWGKNYDWCKSKCDKESWCNGFEYAYNHCEIWKTYPQSFEYKHGFECYYKPKGH